MIIDYSFWRPPSLPGVNGVIRYLSRSSKKAITPLELAWHHAEGRATGLYFEDTAARAAGGYAAGEEDGNFCVSALRALHVPELRPVFAAADFDIPDYAPSSMDPLEKLGPVGKYFQGFRAVLRPAGYEAAGYGGYWFVKRAIDAKLIRRAIQTDAWSGGQFDHRACLHQTGFKVPGWDADLLLAGWRDWGQFRADKVMLTGAPA